MEIVKNRRYTKLKELIKEGEYFSEEEIKSRDPLLHYVYIGRFKRNADITSTESLTELLFSVMDRTYDQKEIEQALTEYIKRTGKGYFDGAVEEAVLREESLSREEQDENEDELIRIMHDKFIKGEDKEFNYRTSDYFKGLTMTLSKLIKI